VKVKIVTSYKLWPPILVPPIKTAQLAQYLSSLTLTVNIDTDGNMLGVPLSETDMVNLYSRLVS
jgi:hypothetical protein